MTTPSCTYKIATRLAGTPQQYHTLVINRPGQEPEIHTSKLMSYITSRIPKGAVRIP